VIICVHCHAYIPEDNVVAHMRWHDDFRDTLSALQATVLMHSAHQENLIERMHSAEKKHEALASRVHLVERAAPGQMY
jgi:hypothetical protein